jgi:hypothetical protein
MLCYLMISLAYLGTTLVNDNKCIVVAIAIYCSLRTTLNSSALLSSAICRAARSPLMAEFCPDEHFSLRRHTTFTRFMGNTFLVSRLRYSTLQQPQVECVATVHVERYQGHDECHHHQQVHIHVAGCRRGNGNGVQLITIYSVYCLCTCDVCHRWSACILICKGHYKHQAYISSETFKTPL